MACCGRFLAHEGHVPVTLPFNFSFLPLEGTRPAMAHDMTSGSLVANDTAAALIYDDVDVDEQRMGRVYEAVRYGINNIAMPTVFCVGIFGNIMNLIVLGRKRFVKRLNHIERSALTGLIFLALSDFMFCLMGVPAAFLVSSAPLVENPGPMSLMGLYYNIYRSGLMNMFLFTSTWMIVSISMERYLAICHPFKARSLIRVRRSVGVHSSIFALSVLMNVLLFTNYEVTSTDCPGGQQCICYYMQPTDFYMDNPLLYDAHKLLWAILGTFLPLLLLLISNSNIANAVYRASKLSPPVGSVEEEQQQSATSRVTITLIVMVVLFVLLVGPSMILTFLTHYFLSSGTRQYYGYRLAVLFTNFCQAVKFATNFMLYCVTNKQFRDNVSNVLCRTSQSKHSNTLSNKYKLVEVNI